MLIGKEIFHIQFLIEKVIEMLVISTSRLKNIVTKIFANHIELSCKGFMLAGVTYTVLVLANKHQFTCNTFEL